MGDVSTSLQVTFYLIISLLQQLLQYWFLGDDVHTDFKAVSNQDWFHPVNGLMMN